MLFNIYNSDLLFIVHSATHMLKDSQADKQTCKTPSMKEQRGFALSCFQGIKNNKISVLWFWINFFLISDFSCKSIFVDRLSGVSCPSLYKSYIPADMQQVNCKAAMIFYSRLYSMLLATWRPQEPRVKEKAAAPDGRRTYSTTSVMHNICSWRTLPWTWGWKSSGCAGRLPSCEQ